MRHRDDEDRTPTPAEQIAGTMFDAPVPTTDPRTLVRGTDPLTSHDAVAQVLPTLNEQEQTIHGALCTFGGHGATVKAIAAHLGGGWDYVRVARRIAGMRDKQLLVSYDGVRHVEIIRERCAVHVAIVDGHQLGEPPEATTQRQTKLAQELTA